MVLYILSVIDLLQGQDHVAGSQTKVAGPQPCGGGLVPGEPNEQCEQAVGGRQTDT